MTLAQPRTARTGPVKKAGRLLDLRHSSPGRLQLFLALLITLGLVTGLVAGLAANAAKSGTSDLAGRSQPLMIQAEAIYTKLAEADQLAAQAFLSGGLEPVALTDKYNQDLKDATDALTRASRLTGDSRDAADQVHQLADGLPQYTQLVAAARAANRQGLPLGASYLAAASAYNTSTLLPAARKLFDDAQTDVMSGYDRAAGRGWLALFVTLLVLLAVGLVASQLYLSRHTHRTFNVPLLFASAATAVLALLTAGILETQGAHLDRARGNGSTPVAMIVNGQILALEARSAEALTLAAHGSVDKDDTFNAAIDRLVGGGGPLDHPYTNDADSVVVKKLDAARTAAQAYKKQHDQVRALDTSGHYDEAVAAAISDKSTGPFGDTLTALNAALADRQSVFAEEIHDASRGLGLLTVAGPLLALLICALAYAGLRPRLLEYR